MVTLRTLSTKFRGVAVAAALAVGVSAVGLASAPTVAAAGWNCNYGFSTVGPWKTCANTDSGGYAVQILCRNKITATSYVKTGNRVYRSGQLSSIQSCNNWYENFYGQPF